MIGGGRVNQIGNAPLVKLNLRIDQEDKEKLEAYAAQDRRKLSDYIRIVLVDHIRERENAGG